MSEAASRDLEAARARIALRGLRIGEPLVVLASCASTNDEAKEAARAGAPHGAVWAAEAQTNGRGRQGRVWQSTPGDSLVFSVLLRVACVPARVPQLSLACGIAVRDAVARAIGDDGAALVKWPNDVLVRGTDGVLRKVAGILVESSVSGARANHVVVGVGVNVHARAFPAELAHASSVALERAARGLSGAPDRAEILTDVLAGLDREVELVAHRGLGPLRTRLATHDALAGREVAVEGARGVALGIDAEGRLLLRTADGETARVASGEVHLGTGVVGSEP